jgi:DeoR/GlpR family transcriptional regulator of sugar metabolism
VRDNKLSNRQALALDHVIERGSLSIDELQHLCPGVSRRSLQRDLKGMVDSGVLVSEGATNQLVYRLKTSE